MQAARPLIAVLAAGLMTLVGSAVPAQPAAQRAAVSDDDPWRGSWRGTVTLPDGETVPMRLTIMVDDRGYQGVVTGFEEGVQIRATSVHVDGDRLVVEATAPSDLGEVAVRYELSADDPGLAGVQRYRFGRQHAEFPVELTRRARRDVPQPQVEQRLDYFVGTWALSYTGGEFPPLSQGTRTARLQLSPAANGRVLTGTTEGEAWGDAYEESIQIAYDEAAQTLLFRETLWNGVELVSLGSWQSPIAVSFTTLPVEADGQVYELRRLFSMTSEHSFMVTDEFSVDGGPFQRLGNGTYSRVP